MQVKLNYEWMGHQPGSIVNLVDNYAKLLIDRGAASDLEVKESVVKIQRRDKDKMVENSLNK